MERPLAHLTLGACGRVAVLLGAMLAATLAAAAQPVAQSAPEDSHPLQEVQVTASKLDRHTLKRVTIEFVESHTVPSSTIDQLGRWRMDVCPRTTGLEASQAELVSRRVLAVAQSVGAPTRGVGKSCRVNVDIVFTQQPQQLLRHIAKVNPLFLGSSRSAGDATMHRAIEAWYLTGTRTMNGVNSPDAGFGNANSMHEASAAADAVRDADMLIRGPSPLPFTAGLQVDMPGSHGTSLTGLAGSHLTKGLTSELLHVLVVVNGDKVNDSGDSLSSISDYIAMLALTRIGSLDACGQLPSIIDLLSSGCREREKPQALTDADTAYLKALYSSDLETNLNIEQGDMRDRMVKVIMGR